MSSSCDSDCWPPGRPPSSLYGQHSPTYAESDASSSSCFHGDTDADTSCVSCSCHDTTLDSCHCNGSPGVPHHCETRRTPPDYRHHGYLKAPGRDEQNDEQGHHRMALLERDSIPGQTILFEESTPLNQKACVV